MPAASLLSAWGRFCKPGASPRQRQRRERVGRPPPLDQLSHLGLCPQRDGGPRRVAADMRRTRVKRIWGARAMRAPIRLPSSTTCPTISVSTATEGPEPITYQHAATMPAYAPTGLSSELAEAKIAPAVRDHRVGPRRRWRRWRSCRRRGDRCGCEPAPISLSAMRRSSPSARTAARSISACISTSATRCTVSWAASPTVSAISRWSAISSRMSARALHRRQATCCRCSNPSCPWSVSTATTSGPARRRPVSFPSAMAAAPLPTSWRRRAAATRPTASP